jgi:long-chain acyl-CoA synthetase
MTENCAISHSTLPGSPRTGTVGLPYEGVQQRIDSETGEIQMRCAALMQGYFKAPEQTQAALTSDGWLRTGDKGSVDKDGYLSITGRVKDNFKTSKGKYVAPAPLEDLLGVHPDIEACMVAGANLTQPLGLVMLSQEAVARSASSVSKLALTESLNLHLESINGRLEAHEKLDCLVVITMLWTPENGYVTPTLKVKRARVEEAYADQYAVWLDQGMPVVWADA